MVWLKAGKPAILLAPMEGITDAPMRALLTERGAFTLCVTEFFRISQDVPHAKVIADHVPELKNDSKTLAGTPVQLQFLGGDPDKLAEAASRACIVGATAIDLNFGCPAPTVNRHDGGATLLKYPERIRTIVAAVRNAVPPEIPVSAKMRLGWDSIDPIHKNADMAAEGGASWITIHGRTKVQGYTPPAYWKPIGEVRRRLSIPVVANGEIWTIDALKRCRDQTECEHFMIGRSALADPTLPHKIAAELGINSPEVLPIHWPTLFKRFAELCEPYADNPNYTLCRIKQWLRFTSMGPQALDKVHVENLKRSKTLAEFFEIISEPNAI